MKQLAVTIVVGILSVTTPRVLAPIKAATIGHYSATKEALGVGVTQYLSANIALAVDDLGNEYGHAVVSTNEITPAFLQGVDIFYTGLLETGVPYSERIILRDFVETGGTLIVQQDQPLAPGFGAASVLLPMFGANSVDVFSGSEFVISATSTDALLTQPNDIRGHSIQGSSASAFSPGASFSVLATSTQDGMPILIAGSFGNGRVIGISDIGLFQNNVYERTNINGQLWQNLFTVPEPASLGMMAPTIVLVIVRNRGRQNGRRLSRSRIRGDHING